jgi:hypothetical protein
VHPDGDRAIAGGQGACGRRCGTGGTEAQQGRRQRTGGVAAACLVVGAHLHQQRHHIGGVVDQAQPGQHPAQRGKRQQDEVVAAAGVGTLVGEHRRQLGAIQPPQRAGAYHHPGAEPGQAIRCRGRMVEHQRTRCPRVIAGDQSEQPAVTASETHDLHEAGDQRAKEDPGQREAGQQRSEMGRRQLLGQPPADQVAE